MKFFLLFSLGLFSMFAVAQLPEGLKYDVLEYSSDSSFVLVKKGKKNTLYDAQTGEVKMTETKEVYLNFPGTNCYAYFDGSGLDYWIYWLDQKDFVGVDNSGETCKLYFPEPTLNSSEVQYNNSVFNIDSRDFDDNRFVTEGEFDWSHLEVLHISEQRFIINCFERDYYYTDTLGDGLFYDGFNHSGIYDLKKRIWLLEPIYKEIYKVNDHILCLREERIETVYNYDRAPSTEYVGTYYVYDTDLNLVDSFPADLSESTIEKVRMMLNYDELILCSDDVHFISRIGKKYGFIKLELLGEFEIDELVPVNADYLNYSEFYHAVVAYYKDSLNPLVLYDTDVIIKNKNSNFQRILSSNKEAGLLIDPGENSITYLDEKYSRYYRSIDERGWFLDSALRYTAEFSNFGLFHVNDTLLIVNNHDPSRFDYGSNPLMSILYPGEDSVIVDPNTGEPNIVYPFYEGFYKTGVFNLNKRSWHIDPDYQFIFFTGKNFVMQRGDGSLSSTGRYEVADIFGTIILESTSYADILSDPEKFKLILPQSNVDSIFEAPTGAFQHTLKKNDPQLYEAYRLMDPVYYVRCGSQLGLYQPDERFNNTCVNETFEFVHFNPVLEFYFYLKGDSIYLKSPLVSKSLSKDSGKIIFLQPNYLPESENPFLLYLIENGDTLIFGEQVEGYDLISVSSFEVKGDLILLNDHTTFVDQSCTECWDKDVNLISYSFYYESESSSVWKKFGDSWQQISPYYAMVAAIPNNHFVVSTGFYEYESFDYDLTGNLPPKVEIEGRYLLLDSNMRAIQYMDYFDFAYIEDLGFGLKIQLNKGDKFFFMTYDLVAVTDAEWDHFELENGKLKAVIETKFEVDPETGEFIYNEFGTPNELVSSTTKYFKLP